MKYIVVDAAKESDRHTFAYTLTGALRELNQQVFITTEKDFPREFHKVPTLADGGCTIDDLIFAQQMCCRVIGEWNHRVPEHAYVIQDGGWLTQVRRCFQYVWRSDRYSGIRTDELNRLSEAWRSALRSGSVQEQYITLRGSHLDPSIQEDRLAWYNLTGGISQVGQDGCVARPRFVFQDRAEQAWAALNIDDLPPYSYVKQYVKRPMLTKLHL